MHLSRMTSLKQVDVLNGTVYSLYIYIVFFISLFGDFSFSKFFGHVLLLSARLSISGRPCITSINRIFAILILCFGFHSHLYLRFSYVYILFHLCKRGHLLIYFCPILLGSGLAGNVTLITTIIITGINYHINCLVRSAK